MDYSLLEQASVERPVDYSLWSRLLEDWPFRQVPGQRQVRAAVCKWDYE